MNNLSFENIENKIGNDIFSFPRSNPQFWPNDYIRNHIHKTILTSNYADIIDDVNGNLINEING